MNKVVLDTNLYIGWLNTGAHEELMVGAGLTRYLSAVVHMELRVGATTRGAQRALDQLVRGYRAGGRLFTPTAAVFEQAGRVLRQLRSRSVEVRRASLVNDVLIALSASALGATLYTRDTDFTAISAVHPMRLQLVT